jgi:predicted alpha/beta hydrolase
LEAGGQPQTVVIRVRRYRCRGCGALVAVVPRGVLRGRHYSAGAIGLALVLFGVVGLPLAEVRARVSPWSVVGETARTTWLAVRRWIRAVRERRLFARVRTAPATWSARQIAERVAMTLEAHAPPTISGEIAARAFVGAAYAA